MSARPHEDPNCKCKACEEWAQPLEEALDFLREPQPTGYWVITSIGPTSITWDDGAKGQ